MNDKGHILTQEEDINQENINTPLQNLQGINKIFALIINCPARIVSFSLLNAKGFFRCHIIEGISGKRLMERVADEMHSIGIGRMESITVQGNNSKVEAPNNSEMQTNKKQFTMKPQYETVSKQKEELQTKNIKKNQ